jgi:hypothetical protein
LGRVFHQADDGSKLELGEDEAAPDQNSRNSDGNVAHQPSKDRKLSEVYHGPRRGTIL